MLYNNFAASALMKKILGYGDCCKKKIPRWNSDIF